MNDFYDDRRVHWKTWPHVLAWCALGLFGWGFLAFAAWLLGAKL